VVEAFLERLMEGDEDGAAGALAPELLATLPAGASLVALLGLEAAPALFAVEPPPCRPLESLTAEVRALLVLTSGARPAYLFRLNGERPDQTSPAEWRIAEIALQAVAAPTSDAARELAALPALEAAADFRRQLARLAALLEVHNALLSLCAGRRDAVAVLSLPEHFDRADILAWEAGLRAANTDADGLALSYAAVYHPWVQLRETATPELALLRHQPPDGAACGIIAARELARGPWIAPANLTLRGVVGLVPGVGEREWVDLFDAHVNLLRREPGRFTEMSAHTLSHDPTLLQLSVRRLLIYLRKLCLRHGMQYVFEPNDERFRRRVEAGLERTMERLTAGGALAAYQVVTGEGLNSLNDRDNGRFIVAIKVAPTQPIEFITVALLRTGEGLLQVVEA
jgi:phage tail sheath protein FI